MSYYIPSGEKIEKALNKVLKRFRTVSSQHRLQQLVKKELKAKKGEQVGVSETRLRHIAINSGLVDLEIHTREGDPNKILARCPVCESSLKRVKNLTIWGGQVTIEFTCPICGYWTGKKKRIPTRYIFHLKKGK
ncbi:hypothetical protein B6U70_02935 [Euryarchaeota archaeon ex4484_162]|nr:MAG: hypothetical protein B6U70_02935 [Euryarchaeota archaeon ex4484_162]RLF29591.1 MAG: hypothetical protein DRN05_01340 [Thermoplasmata archaeon]RLF36402.1 MAG: hypothetical protein DRN08_01375 [Thermoplasmata archaeon]